MDRLFSLQQGILLGSKRNIENLTTMSDELNKYKEKGTVLQQRAGILKDSASEAYNKFFCIDKNGQRTTNCDNPKLKTKYLDKIIKNRNDYYYVNKYGYVKQIRKGGTSNDWPLLCSSKTTIEFDGNIEDLYSKNASGQILYKYKSTMNLENRPDFLKMCDSGNYNLSNVMNGNTRFAYLSPSGQILKYGVDLSTDSVIDSVCSVLPVSNIGKKEWDIAMPSAIDGKFSDMNDADSDRKTSSMANCFPYIADTDAAISSVYKDNLKNKIKADIEVNVYWKKYEKLIEEYEFLRSNTTDEISTITEEGGPNANDYTEKIVILKEKMDKFEASDQYKDYIRKISSTKFQSLIWGASAVLLGLIAIKQIRSI
tara:strand:- start:1175 stop:2281 length:1107 start_codon:yes stop_codon:yes gene_type:complete